VYRFSDFGAATVLESFWSTMLCGSGVAEARWGVSSEGDAETAEEDIFVSGFASGGFWGWEV